MSKMKTIVCPYCCTRYKDKLPMWFRAESGEVEVDQKLKEYYQKYVRMSEEDAERAATVNKAVLIDIVNNAAKVGSYNTKMFQDYGFVVEIEYDGELLTKRLCPNCHNELVDQAGFHDMKLIGLYGDTSVGKTVYLIVLEALLKGDDYLGLGQGDFHGTIEYLGTETDKKEHDENYKMLIQHKTLFRSTPGGVRVKPQAFLYTYRVGDRAGTNRNMILVFCDIPGEDTREQGKLQTSGFYLREVDGILALFDPTRLPGVIGHVRNTVDDPGNENDQERAVDSLDCLKKFLAAEIGVGKLDIPTAIITPKLDVLRKIAAVTNLPEYKRTINAENPNRIHEKYLNLKVITDMNQAVRSMLGKLGGETFCIKAGNLFGNCSYFTVSALGKSPSLVKMTTENGEEIVEKKIEGNLEPLRVAEPFYWLMAQFDGIPFLYREIWKHTKTRFGREPIVTKEKIEISYYSSEREEARKKLRKVRKERRIDEGKAEWQRIEMSGRI